MLKMPRELAFPLIFTACAVLVGPSAAVGGMPQIDWAGTAVDDLHSIRATLRAHHPGPYDELNPEFKEWFHEGFGEALRLATQAASYAGYRFALKRYVVGFQDGHLGVLGEYRDLDPKLEHAWPGFSVGYRDGSFRVVTTDGEASKPQQGDQLVACDGKSLDSLAKETLGQFVGPWEIRGARSLMGPRILIDEGNPFIKRLSQCRFESADSYSLELLWRPIAVEDAQALIEEARESASLPIGLHEITTGVYWVALSSFDLGNEEASAALSLVLERLQSLVETNKDDIAGVVFDVRGNTGGSSTFGDSVAEALWGREAVAANRPVEDGVEWRVSSQNLRFLREVNLARFRKALGEDHEVVRDYALFVERYSEAVEKEDRFLFDPFSSPVTSSSEPTSASPFVLLLTDGMCGSACLDFADVVLSMPGTVHIGRETSADTVYIDNRGVRLPSGLGILGFSMKVYRGRIRGHNEGYIPEHRWTGSMADQASLEHWVLDLLKRSTRE